MQRRGFLKRLAGVATAAVISEKIIPDDGVALRSMQHPIPLHDAAHHDLSRGFGLAPAKVEGSAMLYDDPLAPSRSGILTRSEFGKQLADSLNDAFKCHYENEPDWEAMQEHWADDF